MRNGQFVGAAYALGVDATEATSPDAFARNALTGLKEALGCTRASALFETGGVAYLEGAHTSEDAKALAAFTECLSEAPNKYSARSTPLVQDDQQVLIDSGPLAALRQRMGSSDYSLVCSLPFGRSCAGVLALGPKADASAYNDEELEFVSVMATQLALRSAAAAGAQPSKQTREMVTRTDRLSSIGAMTAGLAHEIRNPLVSIRTFTQLLPEKYQDDEFRSTFLDLTLSEIDRVCMLVGELLTFARPAGSGNDQAVDVVDCAERICMLLTSEAKRYGVKLSATADSEMLSVFIDEDRFKQVLMNLVMNAVQADGRTVEVRCFAEGDSAEPTVCIEVRDDGRGMDEDTVRQVFDSFFTTRKEGTGLGLPIAKQIIEEHGGSIEVTSTLGEGTAFRVVLPPRPAATDEAPTDAEFIAIAEEPAVSHG